MAETVSVPKCPPRRKMLCAVSHQPDRQIPRMGYCTVAAQDVCPNKTTRKKLPLENAGASTLNLKLRSESHEYGVLSVVIN